MRGGPRAFSSPFDQGRFLPGTMLTDRYRIFGLLGRGGMGEVYRADDLKLGQAVALKFLPERVERDEARLGRFLNEVKMARQISHPSVCRVYDVGEVDGHHFLSMEYVDGEDLASLLRRIGRLPKDKAIQIARQICAGLAAAHEQGILHRDLKPANVMVDGRGRARITDFGLAGLAEELGEGEGRVGTPAYMSPEQEAGKALSVKSDLYSLGLVLYELFTGQMAFKAATPAERARLQQETTPTNPSSLIEGFDPAVERVILRCLENDPRSRPGSALAVAASLPGGDPLAAALAAGETPSPELVAEAGEAGGLSPAVAAACLGTLVLAFLLVVALAGRTQLVRLVPLPKSPDVLADRAHAIIQRFGYTEPPGDSTFGFDFDAGSLQHLVELDPTSRRWDQLVRRVPGLITYWYRQSPRYLIQYNDLGMSPMVGDPPLLESGMVGISLDPAGALRRFEAVPPERDDSRGPWPDPDWSLCFAEARLDPAKFKPATASWSPAAYADARAAWEGAYPYQPGTPIRIEAAAYHGRPVSFRIIEPWTRATRMGVDPDSPMVRGSETVLRILIFLTLVGGLLLARRNSRLGRGDRKGAIRLALVVASTFYLGWILKAHHTFHSAEMSRWLIFFSLPLLTGCVAWVLYLALEPHVRRLWPQVLVSWVRLLDGRFRDPLVGRDVLLGLLVALGLELVEQAYRHASGWLGLAAAHPDQEDPRLIFHLLNLRGFRYSLGNLLAELPVSLVFPMVFLIFLLLLRILARRQWLAVGIFLTVATIFTSPSSADPYLHLLRNFLVSAALLIVLFRFGLLTLVVACWFQAPLAFTPLTFDLSAWYAGNTVLVALVTAATAAYAFRVALAGRPIVRDDILG